MKKLLYTLMFMSITATIFAQEAPKDSFETKNTHKKPEAEEEPRAELDFRADITPVFPGTDAPSSILEKPAQLKLFGLATTPFRDGNVIITAQYNYALFHSFDGGIGYTLQLKHGSIGPRLGFIAGAHYGITPGILAHAGNEKIHFFTQTEFIAEFGNGYKNYIYSLVELSYHPIHLISIGIEPEVKIKFTPIEKEKAEFENELTVFIHLHWKCAFGGIGYVFEPPKLGSEKIQNISALKISFGIKLSKQHIH